MDVVILVSEKNVRFSGRRFTPQRCFLFDWRIYFTTKARKKSERKKCLVAKLFN